MTSELRTNSRRRVRRLAVAHAVSIAGSQAAQIAVVYSIYTTTHSGVWVIAALAASISVTGLVGPGAGWVADRFDRRVVMTVSEAGAGAVYLLMVLAHAPLLLVLGTLAASVVGSPFRAASAAAIPNLVSVEDLAWANGQLGVAFNFALVLGPIMGGGLIAVSGPWAVFALNAATYLFSAGVIAGTSGTFGGRTNHGAANHEPHAVMAGFGLLVTNRLLGCLGAASALAFGAFGTALVIDPALAVHFHAGSVGYGLLTSTWGAGAVVGSLTAGRLVSPDRAPALIVVGLGSMALSLGAVPVLPDFPLIVAAGTIGGVGSGIAFVLWLVVVQRHVVDAVRGRVVAASETLNQVVFLAGMGLATPTLSWLGAHHAYALTGLVLAVSTVVGIAGLVSDDRLPDRTSADDVEAPTEAVTLTEPTA